jgi:hypothetical protein
MYIICIYMQYIYIHYIPMLNPIFYPRVYPWYISLYISPMFGWCQSMHLPSGNIYIHDIHILYSHFIFTFYIPVSIHYIHHTLCIHIYIYHYISIKAIINRSFYIPMLYPIFCPLYIYMYLGKLIIIFH